MGTTGPSSDGPLLRGAKGLHLPGPRAARVLGAQSARCSGSGAGVGEVVGAQPGGLCCHSGSGPLECSVIAGASSTQAPALGPQEAGGWGALERSSPGGAPCVSTCPWEIHGLSWQVGPVLFQVTSRGPALATVLQPVPWFWMHGPLYQVPPIQTQGNGVTWR